MASVVNSNDVLEIMSLLRDPQTYPERPSRVELIETHISWVFLTDHFAYKLKKPVEFQFLDFSTPQARELACAEEIRLNRRLAHNVYVSMLPITLHPLQGLELDGSGTAIDYVVKMRRLPTGCCLEHLIRTQKLTTVQIAEVAAYLSRFYLDAKPVDMQPNEYSERLAEHCRANRADLLNALSRPHRNSIRRVCGAQLQYIALHKDVLYERVRAGRVVEGHGDLRAEHIFLESRPAIIDCIEFSHVLREVDILDELCFLAMDCERLGDTRVGKTALANYGEATDDQPPVSLIAFYKSYRACVRAKVAALRAEQAGELHQRPFRRQALQYLTWADHYADQLGPPLLLVVGGMMGTGKSTLAKALAETIGAESLHTDQIRRDQFGQSASPAEYGQGIYDEAHRRQVYERLLAKADDALDNGRSVVIDGTFLKNVYRRSALEHGRWHGAQARFVECVCPEDTSQMRIAQRAGVDAVSSEARPELYRMQADEYEQVSDSLKPIRCESTGSLENGVSEIVAALQTTSRRSPPTKQTDP